MTRALHWAMAREVVAVVLAFVAMVFALHLCTGCHPPPPETITEVTENGAAVAQYAILLDACKALGKDAGSFAVYDTCADKIDEELCRGQHVRCQDGGK